MSRVPVRGISPEKKQVKGDTQQSSGLLPRTAIAQNKQMLITETQAGSWEGMYSRIGRWGGPVDTSQVKRAEFSQDSVV